MDPDTYLNRIRRFLIYLLKKELRTGAVRAPTTAWIRFSKYWDPVAAQRPLGELVQLAFNSRMMNVYNLSDMDDIVNEMITHMKGHVENPALLNSRFVFDEVLYIDFDFHQLNLMRGSSYLPLPDWLVSKKAIINPKNEDQECFKSLSRLLSSKNTKHKGKEYFCMNCSQGFKEESSWDEHLDYCINNESVKVEMPHNNLIVQYSDGQFQFKVPFIMYADFKSILEPIQGLGTTQRSLQLVVSTITFHLDGAFAVSLLMENLKIPWGYIVERIVSRSLWSLNWRSSLPLPIISRKTHETFNSQGNG